jgi:hypothetical protein
VISGHGATEVAASPEEVVEFVMDLERYAQADWKIGWVYAVERHGDRAEVCFRGKMAGLPGPKTRQLLEVTSEEDGTRRVKVTNLKSWMDHLYRFSGLVEARPVPGGAAVFHVETLMFAAPWRVVLEPLLSRWLARDTEAEVQRLGVLLGPRDAPPPS